ncbi:hypothetical protein TNCV_4238321 [Trichonephila clavipes]|nr:hypothetical protein TNCV_4238321 [Trichonephila clavipes]
MRAMWVLSHWLEVEVNIASGWLPMGDRYESPVSGTEVTHVGPHIIDTVVTTPLKITNESVVEIAVLPPDASKLTDEGEREENEVNTGILLQTGYHSNTCERDYWSDVEDLDIALGKNCHVTKPPPKVEILFTPCGQ